MQKWLESWLKSHYRWWQKKALCYSIPQGRLLMETHPSEPLKVVDKTGRRSWLGFPSGALLHWGSRPRYPLLDWCLLNSPHKPHGRSWQPLSHLLMPRASPRATHNQQRGKENKYGLRNTALSAQVTAWKKRYYAEAPTLQWCASPIMVGEKLFSFFLSFFFLFVFRMYLSP